MNEKLEELLMKIDEVMNNWLAKHGFSAVSAGLEEDFGWYSSADAIGYTFLACADTDKAFDDLIYEELGCCYDIGTFWTSWFHELGHSVTWYNIKDTDFRNVPFTLIEYLHCPREIVASQWAVEYINTHIEDVMELAREVDELRRQIYSL